MGIAEMETENIMTIELASMAVAMPDVAGHPNRVAFRGVLTVVDVPSQRAPSGAKGHLVVLTRAAADAALPSLLGMALDYSPSLDRHDVRRKVGVITRAELVGRKLELGGYLFARDCPEIVEEIARSAKAESEFADTAHARMAQKRTVQGGSGVSWGQRGRHVSSWKSSLSATAARLFNLTAAIRPSPAHAQDLRGESRQVRRAEGHGAGERALGMSYEVTDVLLADARARVWTLTRVTFTGAAILRRSKAAYQDTWIELG
jgi:hypothetical protein